MKKIILGLACVFVTGSAFASDLVCKVKYVVDGKIVFDGVASQPTDAQGNADLNMDNLLPDDYLIEAHLAGGRINIVTQEAGGFLGDIVGSCGKGATSFFVAKSIIKFSVLCDIK